MFNGDGSMYLPVIIFTTSHYNISIFLHILSDPLLVIRNIHKHNIDELVSENINESLVIIDDQFYLNKSMLGPR